MDLYSENTFLLSLQKQLLVNLKKMQLEREGGRWLYPSKELKKSIKQNFQNFILLTVGTVVNSTCPIQEEGNLK